MSDTGEIYQRKTIEAAVNTIMTKMDELQGATESGRNAMRRRWIWELIQNANDCANESEITILINSSETELTFSHNGDVFTYHNLIDLITQISSKRINGEDTTGKFGTGFISTHLISEIVKVKGIYHRTPTSNNYKFMCLNIDRSGKTEQDIKDSITTAISELDVIDGSHNIEWPSTNNEPTTSFIYDLTRKNSLEVHEAIDSGCRDLDRSISFVFAFTKTIKEVHCDGVTYKRNSETVLISDQLKIVHVVKTNDGKETSEIQKVLVCYDKENEVSIATFIESRDDKYYICPIRDVPKLFCLFPLIGTENFGFPVVINSPKFKVLQERNHIQEGAEINRGILEIGISLYKIMLEHACRNDWNNLYNLCYMNHSKESVFQKKTSTEIQKIYHIQPIVDVHENSGLIRKESLYVAYNGELKPNILIPSMDNKELDDELWELTKCLNTKAIPTKDSYKHWLAICPTNKITLETIYTNLLKGSTVNELSAWFTDKSEILSWLNKLYGLWLKSTDENSFAATAIVPNQEGQFSGITKVSVDHDIDDVLKDILTLLGTDIKKKLLHRGITVLDGIEMNSWANEDVANKINDHVRKQLSDESTNSIKRSQEIQNIFNMLTDWFLKMPELAKSLFKDIYDKQHLLSSPEETARRLELATTVESAMHENNIELEQLKTVLKESGRLLQMFKEGKIELSEDARKLFEHISSKSPYAKEKLDNLIQRSISSVYDELSDNHLYSVENTLDEWKRNKYSTTVFKARKQDVDIRIIIRPSDDDKIIFYDDAELEALDDTAYELWTDNGQGKVMMITLGDLIKTTGISVIPLRKIL